MKECTMKTWMTALSLIFCPVVFVYLWLYPLIIPESQQVPWAAFVAMPIYFIVGAKKEDFHKFFYSMLAGFFWAYMFLLPPSWLLNLYGWRVSPIVTGALVVFVVNAPFLLTHLVWLANSTWLSVCPIMFGTVASTFATGGQRPFGLIVALTLGMLIALVCVELTNAAVGKPTLSQAA
ncbi:hypothetical protein ES706_03718 [subsurface metagenome]|nr:DUF1097 domain-containing protein [Bacillota bacterium]